jgi:hypothetical protein
VWNHGGGGFSEGVRGWLTPTRTAEYARALHRSHHLVGGQSVGLQAAYLSELVRRFARLRDLADQAWELGHGLLCGNALELSGHAERPRFTDPHPSYGDATVQQLARAIRDRREFDVLPVLADALQEAGCENDVVLTHCRDANEHTDACWVADVILASEVTRG